MNLRPQRLLPVLVVAALAATLVPSGAGGAPVDDKRAQAAALQAQIDANGSRIDVLSEEANGARYRLDQATAAAKDAQTRIDAAQTQADHLADLLRGRAASIYKSAGSSTPLDAVDVGNARAFQARSKYAAAAANRDNSIVDQLQRAKEDLTARKQEYEATIAQAKQEQDRITASQREIQAANGRQQQLLGQVKGEIATLVHEEQVRAQAAAAARAQALVSPRGGRSGARGSAGPESFPANLPSASGGAGAAIAFARAQLGKPYVYAATGPDSYDCSGLTMRAWEAGGVSMPHYSGAQYDMFPHVPLDAMQPGDLVFWGSGGSDHVALYIGGGQVITAPHTGDVVKVASLYGSPVGAARPG